MRSLAVLSFFAVVYFGASVWVGFNKWIATLSALPAEGMASILALIFFGFLLRALRWHYYTSLLGWQVPALHRFTAFVASFAFTATPGKAGELVKGLLLRSRYEISLSQTAGILLVERLGDLLAVVLLSCGGLLLFADLRVYVIASAVLIGLIAVVTINPSLARLALERILTIPKLGTIARKSVTAFNAGGQLLRPLPLLIGTALAAVSWGSEAVAFSVIVNAMGIHSPLPISLSIYGLSTLAGALSMLPGGLGGVEVVMGMLLTRLHAPAATATIVVILFRLLTLWLFSLIGLCFMLGWVILVSKSPNPSIAADVQ